MEIGTTIYEIETADEYGDWHKVLTTRDPLRALSKAAELACDQKSTRQTTLYEKDQIVKPKPAQMPSIGRIVHYYQGSTDTVLPAIVQAVGPVDETGMPKLRLDVRWTDREDSMPLDLMRPFSAEYSSGCWSWPPRA
ncbi:hypothetical protein SEA_TIMINATOR_66 [Arthrobacter phage Timinator]|uniref:Uncharacterized protein n=2 Tax=Marthavirus barretlemon TaxID=2560300 RepID=A0A386KQP5_9CAUD|nr:hypothetical protein SEA_TIMINATOR_66 [Arthrobacter phage Timinator]AYD86537.1 hypothetical protein SEA_LEEROYJ_66 [Arthrobacter phage LeeroyJ]